MRNECITDFSDRVQKERTFFDRILQKYPFLAAGEGIPVKATRSSYLCLSLGLDPKALYRWTHKWAEKVENSEELNAGQEQECEDAIQALNRFVDLCFEIEPHRELEQSEMERLA